MSDETNKPKADKKATALGCLVLVVIAVFIGVIVTAITGGGSDDPSEEAAAPTPTKAPYCLIIMKHLNEAVVVMGNAGTTATVDDVASVLKESGQALTQGFDANMAGSVERLNLLNDAGEQLLKIRVAVLDGGSVEAPAAQFKADYDLIKSTC